MIDPRELRLGCLVEYFGETRVISAIFNNGVVGVSDNPCETALLNPIPITEQWLIDFGFEKKGYNKFYDKDGFIKLTLEDNDWFAPCIDIHIKTVMMKDYFYITCVGSVHELQNKIPVFTGEELEIKTQKTT